MDTVGILSFPSDGPASKKKMLTEEITVPKVFDFQHDYLDANTEVLDRFAGTDEETVKAKSIRTRLRQVRQQLQLDRIIGYSPFTYSIQVGLNNPLSLVQYWVDRVVASKLLVSKNGDEDGRSCPGFFIGGTGSLRYDLLRGPIVVDDIWAMAPFQEGYRVVRCVPGKVLLATLAKLPSKLEELGGLQGERNEGWQARPFHPSLPPFVHSTTKNVRLLNSYDLVFGLYESEMILHSMNTDKQQKFVAEPYREDEGLNGHTLWIKYFTEKSIGDSFEEPMTAIM
jgi:hypothetical protein